MANFGDLPRGEIPEPLKYNRPYSKLHPSSALERAFFKYLL